VRIVTKQEVKRGAMPRTKLPGTIKSLMSVAFTLIFLCSCRSDKLKRDAEAKAREFFGLLHKEDEAQLARLYPGFGHFEEYYRSDSGAVVNTTESNGIISVVMDNRYTTKSGKGNREDITLYFKADSLGNAVLFDSKGLCNFSENETYVFGSRLGASTLRRIVPTRRFFGRLSVPGKS
jgi:hypothetical protein